MTEEVAGIVCLVHAPEPRCSFCGKERKFCSYMYAVGEYTNHLTSAICGDCIREAAEFVRKHHGEA